MWLNKITNEVYKNRKVAKEILGHYNYNRLYDRGDIIYINDDFIAAYEQIHTNSNGTKGF